MRCPRCDCENDPAGSYCQQCGTYLHTSIPAPQPQAGFPIPPPAPLGYSTPPVISAGMPAALSSSQHIVSPRPRMAVFRVIRSIVYFLATFLAAFGLIGSMAAVLGESGSGAILATCSGLGVLVAGVIIFVRMRHRMPQLRVAHFIWGILGVTVGMFMALVFVVSDAANTDLAVGYIFLMYGVVVAATSLW